MGQLQQLSLDEQVDVLIVGAGPAGLMTSLYLTEMGISHRIIDQRGTRALNGRADGFQVRTVEIWDSFGIASRLHEYANHFGEWAMWSFDHKSEKLVRQRREPSIGVADSRQKTATFSQGHIEACLIEAIKKRGGPSVERGSKAVTLSVYDPEITETESHPVKITVRRLCEAELEPWPTNAHHIGAKQEIEPAEGWSQAFGADHEEIQPRIDGEQGSTVNIHARYVVGADGGHSWVRHQLGEFSMEGANSDSVWGVIDLIPITDFPDIRRICTILSPDGTILLVPCEKGLVRFYIQLADDSTTHSGATKSQHKAEAVGDMLAIARKVFSPYSLDYKYCDWWTTYKVGQRVCNKFSHRDRVFLMGDAVHTHTPKGGQGMNVSQQDAYNLAWKLGTVIRGEMRASALSTYVSERRPIAQELVALDSDMAKVLTARIEVPLREVQDVYDRLRFYGTGVNLCYSPNALIASAGHAVQGAAKNLKLGTRCADPSIFYLATGAQTSLLSLLRSKGCWYLLTFGGDVLQTHQRSKINALGEQLKQLQQGTLTDNSGKLVRAPSFRNILILPTRVSDVEITQFHEAFSPRSPLGNRDYDAIVTDLPSDYSVLEKHITPEFGIRAYDYLEIGKEDGALCLVRPDQVISWVGGIDDMQLLLSWISSFTL